MTTIKIKKQNNSIIQVECSGHSGYAEEGSDIVCAAISTLVQTAAEGLIKEAKVQIDKKQDDNKGYFKITLQKNLDEQKRHDCDLILNTMLRGIEDLQEGFSKYVKLEVN